MPVPWPVPRLFLSWTNARVAMEALMPDIIEQLQQDLVDLQTKLKASGKTMNDARAFRQFYNVHRHYPPNWNELQIAIWGEIALTEALLADHLGTTNFSQDDRTKLARYLAKQRERRTKWELKQEADAWALKLAPDILRGRKVLKAGAEAHGTKETRRREAVEFYEIWRSLNDDLSDTRKYELFVIRFKKKYEGKKVKVPSATTIRNRFKEFSSELGVGSREIGLA
jgi:hypothetical protein